jgi:hypothetical protein
LEDEAIAAANILMDFDHHFAVGETTDLGLAKIDVEILTDLTGQRGIGITRENFQLVLGPFRHLFRLPRFHWRQSRNLSLHKNGPGQAGDSQNALLA